MYLYELKVNDTTIGVVPMKKNMDTWFIYPLDISMYVHSVFIWQGHIRWYPYCSLLSYQEPLILGQWCDIHPSWCSISLGVLFLFYLLTLLGYLMTTIFLLLFYYAFSFIPHFLNHFCYFIPLFYIE